MKNKILKIAGILFLASIGYSCSCDHGTYVIDEEDRLQMNLFDTAIFSSETGVFDTLYIGSRTENIDPNDIDNLISSGCEWYYQHRIWCKYIQIENGIESGGFAISQSSTKKDFEIRGWNNTYGLEFVETIRKIELNGITYKKVWKFEKRGEVFYANSEYGLIKYEIDGQPTMTLSKYIKEK